MKRMQAYRKIQVVSQVFEYKPLDLLPECKRETRLGKTHEYQKVRKKFLGLIPYTEWLDKKDIVWYPEESVEYCACSYGEADDFQER